MGGMLRHTLVVRHPETLEATPLLAGAEVPEWAAGLVHEDDLAQAEGKKTAARRPAAKSE